MEESPEIKSHSYQDPAKYCIKVRGAVSEDLGDYYSGISIRIKDNLDQQPETEIIGWLADQTALLGLLNLLHDWGHTFMYVEYLPVE